MSIIVLALSLSFQRGSAPTDPQNLAARLRAFLPVTEPLRVENILRDLERPENLVSMNAGKLWLRTKSEVCWGSFNPRTGDMQDFYAGTLLPAPHPEKPLAEEDYIQKAVRVLSFLPPYERDYYTFTVTRGDVGGLNTMNVAIAAHYQGKLCSNWMRMKFEKETGRLISYNSSERLDHARYGRRPTVSRQLAEAAAWDAYQRAHPYASAALVNAHLESGIPVAYIARNDGFLLTHELRPSETECWDNGIATPFWQFWIKPLIRRIGDYGSDQAVTIDALTGRALIVCATTTRSAGPRMPEMSCGDEVIAVVGKAKGTLSAAKAETGVAGLRVGVRIGDAMWTCRYDDATSLLWLPVGKKWKAYRSSALVTTALKSATQRAAIRFGSTQAGKVGAR